MKQTRLVVLALLSCLLSLRFSAVKAGTLDLEIAEVNYVWTDYEPQDLGWIITIHLNVTYRNSGTERIYVNEDDPDAWHILYFRSTTVHESALDQYLNRSGQLNEPLIIGGYQYKSLPGWWTHLDKNPGDSWNEQRQIIIILGQFDPWPYHGQWYYFSSVDLDDSNNYNHLPWWQSDPQDGSSPISRQVGGSWVLTDKPGSPVPTAELAPTILAVAFAAAFCIKRVRREEGSARQTISE